MLDQLHSIDPAVLSEVARQCLNRANALVTEWTVTPVSHEQVIESTAGLFRVQGHAQVDDELQPWSAVLKILRKSDLEDDQAFLGWDYWKREMLAYQSGLLADLPAGIRAPRCFGVSDTQTGGWIWMADIQEPGARIWSLAHFQIAARQLGRFAGAYLVGHSLPNQPWLCRSLFRGRFNDGEWWAKFLNPGSPNNAWQRPVVQQVFSETRRSRVLQIWAEKWQFIEANERIPQVFCHNDAHRKNLMLLPGMGGEVELVGIDWASCGPGGLGNDLGELVGTSLSYYEVEPALAQDLESAAFEGYRAGLQDAGWSGKDRLAWLGYLISLALWWGATLPSAAAELQPEALKINVEAKFGRTAQDVLEGWKTFADFALDRADQARYWMGRLV